MPAARAVQQAQGGIELRRLAAERRELACRIRVIAGFFEAQCAEAGDLIRADHQRVRKARRHGRGLRARQTLRGLLRRLTIAG